MGKQAFEASAAAGGAHHRLSRMAGEWSGKTRVWFGLGQLADESVQHGRIRAVGGGRFFLHEYETTFQGEAQEGVAIHALHLDAEACEIAWADSFHTGTSIMFSSAQASGDGFVALGSYGDGQGGPPWGWRTEIAQPNDDELVITMFNISPGGEGTRAVETRYARVAPRA